MPETRLVKQAVGAAGELLICADLLLRGYYVFRNVSANGPDLVALKDGKCIKIQVKASNVSPDESTDWDMWATANDQGKIRYRWRDGRDFTVEPLPCTGIQLAHLQEFESA